MRKIILDLGIPENKKEVHAYIAEEMEFPEYYGSNLDALYDMLTSITEPTAVGLFLPIAEMDELDFDYMVYLDQIKDVFSDAEEANPDLAVIHGDLYDNAEWGDWEDTDPEELLADLEEADDEMPEDDPSEGESAQEDAFSSEDSMADFLRRIGRSR